jgi:ABC-type sugar transport system permease subunit
MRMLAIRRQNGTMLARRPWRTSVEPYLWVAPALILFFIFSLLPLIVGLGLSFVSWDGITPVRFVGLENYGAALRDSTYWSAIVHNVIYAGGTVIGKMVLGFGLALVLNQAMPGRAIFRTAMFLPVVLSFVVVGLMWNWIYDYNSGLINTGLSAIGLAHLRAAWLGNPSVALGALIIVDIWKWFGFHMVIFLAGLQSIPSELYEAARIDGATRWQLVRRITLPLMVPITMINLILASSGAFNVFDVVYVMTQGGPVNATNVAMMDIYTEAFQFYHFGYASALSVVQLVLVSAISLVLLRVLRRERYF